MTLSEIRNLIKRHCPKRTIGFFRSIMNDQLVNSELTLTPTKRDDDDDQSINAEIQIWIAGNPVRMNTAPRKVLKYFLIS